MSNCIMFTRVPDFCCSVSPSNVVIGSNCYFITGADTWANTQSACAAQGASLATINSASENQAISAAFTQLLWIGLSRPGPYTIPVTYSALYAWIVPGTSSYSNWYPGEPNCMLSSGAYEGCATIIGLGRQTWNDESCTNIHPGLCKYQSEIL